MSEKMQGLLQELTDDMIARIEAGTAPFQKPWKAGELIAPYNPISGAQYRAGNFLKLLCEGYSDPRWMTYKQASGEGYQVRKGSRSTPIVFWQTTQLVAKKDAQGRPVLDAQGKPVKVNEKLKRPRLFKANVFNASQIEGLPPLENGEHRFADIKAAEQIIQASGADLRHDRRDEAYYNPIADSVHLPPKEQFDTTEEYYAVALHELGHWTGHSDRLNRPGLYTGAEDVQAYAREELRAEISSLFQAAKLGLPFNPDRHADYVGGWVTALKEDHNEIHRAARDAGKIADYLFGLAPELAQEQAPLVQQQSAGDPVLQRLDVRKVSGMTHSEIREEFIAAAANMGLSIHDLKGDGQYHRVPVIRPDGRKSHNQDGMYKLHMDGRPAGFIKNWHTGEQMNWKASRSVNHTLSREARQEIAARQATVRQERQRRYDHVSKRVEQFLSLLPKASSANPYLVAKGLQVSAHDDLYQDRKDRLILPLRDASGQARSFMRISGNGFKQLKKGGQKNGCFHVIGKADAGKPMAICEGYSTGKSISEATGLSVIVAVDAGNLSAVAIAAQKAYTAVTLFVAGDDDVENDRNIGRLKAEEAAKAIGSFAIFPKFAAGGSKARTDFNDLAREQGKAAILKQVNTAIQRGQAIETLEQKQIAQRQRIDERKQPALEVEGRSRGR